MTLVFTPLLSDSHSTSDIKNLFRLLRELAVFSLQLITFSSLTIDRVNDVGLGDFSRADLHQVDITLIRYLF